MFTPKSLKITNIISFKDQSFEFRNGKAILIVGQNHDDSSQERNGAGKSSLIEAVALAFTGTSIRDVKTKELINNDADFGEVDLVLINNIKGIEFRIWRKIYTNSNSAEYKAWINGKEQANRYSDLNMFNAFVWDTIGISKEDFFSFYLITKENYTPFLLVGDTKKKEIINRFSGANKIDVAIPEVQKDIETIVKEICDIEKELSGNQAKQELLAEQIIQEEDKNSLEVHNKLITDKEAELETLLQDEHLIALTIENHKLELNVTKRVVDQHNDSTPETLQPYQEALTIAQGELAAFQFSRDYDIELQELKDCKGTIQLEITLAKSELPKVKEQFTEEINAINAEEKGLQESIKEAEKELKEYEQFESDVNKQLQDVITCPKCSHKFSLRDESFNYEEAVKKLPEVVGYISEYKEVIKELKENLNKDIQLKKQEVNASILKAQEGIKNQIEEHNKLLIEVGNQELELKKEQQVELQNKQLIVNKVNACKNSLKGEEDKIALTLQNLQNELKKGELTLKKYEQEWKANSDQMDNLQQLITKLKAQEIDNSRVEKLTKDIEVLIREEEKIRIKLEAKVKEKEEVDAWEIHFKNFKSHLANKSIKNIQDYTNLFLDSMGSNLAINVDGYKTLSNKKIKEQITATVFRDGFDAGSYGKFSGGERGRMDICNIIGMQELITVNAGHGMGLDMLFADEILESVDSSGMEALINCLQSLGKTIMLVSQNEINSLDAYTLTITKRNKVSQILN